MDPTMADLNAPHSMGTTIIGVTYNGGVVLGADSRTSTGVYVANRASDKITQLTDNVYLCRSGSAADSQIVSDYVRYFLHQHTFCGGAYQEKTREKTGFCAERRSDFVGERLSDFVQEEDGSLERDIPLVSFSLGGVGCLFRAWIQLGQPATVKVAANLVRLLSYNNKNMLQTGLIIGGWDKHEGGKIYGVPLGGTILEQPFTIGAISLCAVLLWNMLNLRISLPERCSGSTYLYGFFDQEWKEGMTKEEAEKLVVKAVSLAIARDGASGGVVRTVTINSEGVERKFYPADTLPLWHEELAAHNSLLDILSSTSPDPMVS
ncbi:hypothetical protein LguiA_002492 [Lonicera macranthoides]